MLLPCAFSSVTFDVPLSCEKYGSFILCLVRFHASVTGRSYMLVSGCAFLRMGPNEQPNPPTQGGVFALGKRIMDGEVCFDLVIDYSRTRYLIYCPATAAGNYNL